LPLRQREPFTHRRTYAYGFSSAGPFGNGSRTWPSAASLRQARLRAGAFTRMVRGEGALVFDDGSRRYVDPMASL